VLINVGLLETDATKHVCGNYRSTDALYKSQIQNSWWAYANVGEIHRWTHLHRVLKMSHLWLAITLTHMNIFMAALCNRAGYYIFALWFLSSSFFFFSSPNLSGRRLDVYHTSCCGLSANLECRSEMCCTRLAEKYRMQKIAIRAPSHNFVRIYLRN